MAVLGTTTLTGCDSIPGFIPTGSVFVCFQAAAPTSWTRLATQNDKALRVVSGSGGAAGGTTAFSTIFTATRATGGSVSITNAAVTLTAAQIAGHSHTITGSNRINVAGGGGSDGMVAANGGFSGVQNVIPGLGTMNANTPAGGSHTHANTVSFTAGQMDFAVQYIDTILCSKN
jgi:hypothetical protein